MLDYHDTIRCPVCRKQARVWVQILTTGNGAARRRSHLRLPVALCHLAYAGAAPSGPDGLLGDASDRADSARARPFIRTYSQESSIVL